MKLVKLGYGNLEDVKKFTTREVLQILKFEQFNQDYENVVRERIQKDYRDTPYG